MNFGLPLEYDVLSDYFDASDFNDEYNSEPNIELEKLLRKYNVKTVFDLTCGTGSQVFFLSKLGYSCIGSDISLKLLDISKEKAKKDNLKIEFIGGDMRSINISRKFDACITMFNAVGHISKTDFQQTMKNIFNHLKDNGIYIFDIFNLNALSNEEIKKFAYQQNRKLENSQLLHSQVSTLDEEKRLLISYDSYILQEEAKEPKIFQNEFMLRIYDANELKEMLLSVGFKVINFFDINGKEFIRNKTISMLVIAEK
jgi:SAM-dependent methyltransferase